MKNITLFEITHSEHEESVKFYYTARNDFSGEKQFLDEIDQREEVKLSEQRAPLTKDAVSHVMTGEDFQSFIQHQAVIFDQDNIEGVVIEDQWNFKVTLLVSPTHYILIIWETTA